MLSGKLSYEMIHLKIEEALHDTKYFLRIP